MKLFQSLPNRNLWYIFVVSCRLLLFSINNEVQQSALFKNNLLAVRIIIVNFVPKHALLEFHTSISDSSIQKINFDQMATCVIYYSPLPLIKRYSLRHNFRILNQNRLNFLLCTGTHRETIMAMICFCGQTWSRTRYYVCAMCHLVSKGIWVAVTTYNVEWLVYETVRYLQALLLKQHG